MSWLGKDLTDYHHGTVFDVHNGKRAVLTLPPGLLSAAKPEALLTLKADGTHRKVRPFFVNKVSYHVSFFVFLLLMSRWASHPSTAAGYF